MRAIAFIAALIPALAAAAPATPEQAVAVLWQALSHDAGSAGNAAALRGILHADAVVAGSRYRDGVSTFKASRGADFADSVGRVGEKGFYECEVARQVRVYDRFATVHSVVESRTVRNAAKPDFTGVNSIQLYRADDGWRIVSLYYQVEKPGMPIALDGAVSGACLDAP